MGTHYKEFLNLMDKFLFNLDSKPTFLGVISKFITMIKAGYLTQSEDTFGRKVYVYHGIALVDLGAKGGGNDLVFSIVGIRKPNGIDIVTGLTDLYSTRRFHTGIPG